ncbi:WD repeat-containing protein 73-like [Vipera latastei]
MLPVARSTSRTFFFLQGLCPERDFKAERGGICDRPIYRLKHVPGTSLLVTSGPPDSALQVWRVESDETDVIKLLSVISPTKTEDTSWSKIATSCAKQACILHGQRICNLQMMEVESGQNLWVAASASPDKIASLDFLDEVTAVVCGAKGQLFLVDFRQHQGILGTVEEAQTPWAPTERLSWCAGIGSGETPLIAHLSSAGLVYNTKDWDSSRQEAKPVFIHKGHTFGTPGKDGGSPMVTTHTWHPWKPQTLLSAASDGSLHVWDWSDLRANSKSTEGEKEFHFSKWQKAIVSLFKIRGETVYKSVNALVAEKHHKCLRDEQRIKKGLSSAGLVVLTDIRYPSSPLKVAQCCVPTPNLRGADFLSISFAPVLGNTLAVSGFDGTVQVYNTKDWDSSRQEAKPVFIHKGHTFGTPGKDGGSPVVTTHTWHPWKPQTLLGCKRWITARVGLV